VARIEKTACSLSGKSDLRTTTSLIRYVIWSVFVRVICRTTASFPLALLGLRNQSFQALGATGVIAMKMINNTKRMSIIGVTLISEDIFLLPVENAIRNPRLFGLHYRQAA